MNRPVELAMAFINTTDRHIFLTGKAGTGKTTFLKSLKNSTHKKMTIAAPTGIAAVNASGVTLHSLIGLPTAVFLPGETDLRINLTAEKRILLRELELLVIDEVSMLRADVLDAIDTVLRLVRKEPGLPFGGIQVLYIGDLHQLSPVATIEESRQLEKHYDSLYFTSAIVFPLSNPVCISLEHIYRQTDSVFISVLNAIRQGNVTKRDIDLLNTFYREKPAAISGYVTLVTHNQSADIINAEQLSQMEGEPVRIEAEISGEFDESSYPTEKILLLKVGAQVMLLRNDRGSVRRYFNGKMGTIRKILNEKLIIDFGDADMAEIQKETWRNIRYEFDQKSGTMQEYDSGSFTQFPVRLAWAITIHKSQGLTFDRAMLDVTNVFAPGQAYVAFSRIRSLEGLILKKPVTIDAINANASQPINISQSTMELTQILDAEKIIFFEKTIKRKLDWRPVSAFIAEANTNIASSELYTLVNNTIKQYQTISEKFILELKNIVKAGGTGLQDTINNRLQSASNYFLNDIDRLLQNELNPAIVKSKGSVTQKLHYKFAKDLMMLLRARKKDFEFLRQLISGYYLTAPVIKPTAIKERVKPTKEKDPATMGTALPGAVLVLFNQGLAINEIAGELNVSTTTVENYLATFVSSGELQIHQLIEEKTLKELAPIVEANRSVSAMALKEQFGEALSFGQIKALLNHFKL